MSLLKTLTPSRKPAALAQPLAKQVSPDQCEIKQHLQLYRNSEADYDMQIKSPLTGETVYYFRVARDANDPIPLTIHRGESAVSSIEAAGAFVKLGEGWVHAYAPSQPPPTGDAAGQSFTGWLKWNEEFLRSVTCSGRGTCLR